MPEREKVIKGLEICSAGEWNSTGGRDHTDCPYYPAGYTGCTCKLLMRDALALLKAQEPVKPMLARGWYWCGGVGCRYSLTSALDDDSPARKPNYCEKCGRAVKWE